MRNPLRSLAARITLLVFAATILSSLTVSWISVQSLDGFLRRKVDQRFPQVASRIVQELDHWYTLRTREVEVFAGSDILTESAPELDAQIRVERGVFPAVRNRQGPQPRRRKSEEIEDPAAHGVGIRVEALRGQDQEALPREVPEPARELLGVEPP